MKPTHLSVFAAVLLTSCSTGPNPASAGMIDARPKTGCQTNASGRGESTDTPPTPIPGLTDLPTIPPATIAPPEGIGGTETTEPPPPPRTTVLIDPREGFDRVVYELADRQCPSWRVQYVDAAITYGHSDVLAVPGESILEVTVTGCGTGPDRVRDEQANVVTEVRRPRCSNIDPLTSIPTTQLFIGVVTHRPHFNVTTESNPPRLVIDIADR